MEKILGVVKTNVKKFMVGAVVAANTVMFSVTSVFADGEMPTESKAVSIESKDFEKVYAPIIQLINAFIVPALLIVGALGTLYCILLGVKYAKAEEPQDREKAKTHLKNAIIGFVLIFVLMAALSAAIPILANYAGISLKQ